MIFFTPRSSDSEQLHTFHWSEWREREDKTIRYSVWYCGTDAYIQPLEYKDIYHDVMWDATVTWRARRATDDGKTNGKQKTSEQSKKRITWETHTKVRYPVHFTSVTPIWNSSSVCVRFGRGLWCWGGLGIETMTATRRVASSGGRLKNNRFSGFSQRIGRAT